MTSMARSLYPGGMATTDQPEKLGMCHIKEAGNLCRILAHPAFAYLSRRQIHRLCRSVAQYESTSGWLFCCVLRLSADGITGKQGSAKSPTVHLSQS